MVDFRDRGASGAQGLQETSGQQKSAVARPRFVVFREKKRTGVTARPTLSGSGEQRSSRCHNHGAFLALVHE
jgi:hypothetical protein